MPTHPQLLFHRLSPEVRAFLTDVWALAVTLFYLVNKSFPFPSSDEQMRLAWQMSHSFTFSELRQFEPPDELVDLLKRALEPAAEKRATMDELVAHGLLDM